MNNSGDIWLVRNCRCSFAEPAR